MPERRIRKMCIPRRYVKPLRFTAISYVVGGIAYWASAELFLSYVGKEIVFTPLVSIMLTVPFWSMMVFADLRWVGVMPQDVVSVSALLAVIYLLWIKT
ncbi:MAG: hypothetical protein QXO25_01325 [Candidatus Bathyarchaeia archaeon]